MLLSLFVTATYIATGSFQILLTFVGKADHVLYPNRFSFHQICYAKISFYRYGYMDILRLYRRSLNYPPLP